MKDLDSFDRRILDLLRVNNRRTGEELSGLVGLSPAACLRRVQKLRNTGAIEREVAIIAPEYKTKGTTIIVLLRFEGHNPKAMDEFCHRLRHMEEVRRLTWITGEDDLVAILRCASMEDFSEFCEAHFNDAPVTGYKSLVSMREYDTGEVI